MISFFYQCVVSRGGKDTKAETDSRGVGGGVEGTGEKAQGEKISFHKIERIRMLGDLKGIVHRDGYS